MRGTTTTPSSGTVAGSAETVGGSLRSVIVAVTTNASLRAAASSTAAMEKLSTPSKPAIGCRADTYVAVDASMVTLPRVGSVTSTNENGSPSMSTAVSVAVAVSPSTTSPRSTAPITGGSFTSVIVIDTVAGSPSASPSLTVKVNSSASTKVAVG